MHPPVHVGAKIQPIHVCHNNITDVIGAHYLPRKCVKVWLKNLLLYPLIIPYLDSMSSPLSAAKQLQVITTMASDKATLIILFLSFSLKCFVDVQLVSKVTDSTQAFLSD